MDILMMLGSNIHRMGRVDPREPPDLDIEFDLLANRYRRQVLVALLENSPQTRDDRLPVDSIFDDDDTEALRDQMYQINLPLLEDAGFIDWDRAEDTVTEGPNYEEIRPLLEQMRENDYWL